MRWRTWGLRGIYGRHFRLRRISMEMAKSTYLIVVFESKGVREL